MTGTITLEMVLGLKVVPKGFLKIGLHTLLSTHACNCKMNTETQNYIVWKGCLEFI